MLNRHDVYHRWIVIVLAVGIGFVAHGEHVKVDMDTRNDTTAAGYLSWQPTAGTSQTFGDVTVAFSLISVPESTDWTINWNNKNGINHYELAMDCLYAEYDDGTKHHPSFNGGTIQLTLTGLTEGRHTLITYHNAPWPPAKYHRTIAPCKIVIDDAEVAVVEPSQNVTNDKDVKNTFLTFEAKASTPVVIRLEPVGKSTTQICTAVLNGFEIDSAASVDSFAINPVPADGDKHVFANSDDPVPGSAGAGYTTLSWTASKLAAFQDVYFGTDQVAVNDADTQSEDIYKGRQSADKTTWDAKNLDSKNTYYWRIDTVKADGTVTNGPVWSFQTRHLTFPGAEGYGRFARAGRYGKVIEVTTLEDYDPASEAVIKGSLREAIEVQKGPRIVVFRIGGTIFLKDRLIVPADGGNIYVAGQTAPGDGICLTQYSFGILSSEDAVIRFVRTRVGDYAKKAMDGMGMSGCDYCIIDHCSISWSLDEGHSSRGAKNITFSRNIISEALNDSFHYNDADPQHRGTQTHGFAASISGGIGSYHHNLLVHCTGRNWSLAGGLEQNGQYAGYCDIRNNVVYNWKDRTTDGGVMRCNFVNNLYIPGPATTHFLLMRPDGDQMKTGNPQKFYITGNKIEGKPEYDKNNWKGVSPNYARMSEIRSEKPFFDSYVKTGSVETLCEDVLNDVGATLPKRDAIDARVIQDVRDRGFTYRGSKDHLPGIIDSQNDVGGYPTLNGGPVPADSDHDGLPDWWEKKHNLNIHSPAGDFSNTNADPDGDGFTNMDDYLDYLTQGGALIPSGSN